jgi:type VI protein secretion system component Hcp
MSIAGCRRAVALAVALFVCSGDFVRAQFTPTANLTSTSVSFAGCGTPSQVTSWDWGVSNPSTIGTTGGGKASFSDLTIQKSFDSCSTVLFKDNASGASLATVTLTETDNSKNVLLTMVLTNVRVDSYQIDGVTTSSGPTESVSLVMAQLKITDSGGNSFCWSVLTNTSC